MTCCTPRKPYPQKRVASSWDEDSSPEKVRQVDIASVRQPTLSKKVSLEITEDA